MLIILKLKNLLTFKNPLKIKNKVGLYTFCTLIIKIILLNKKEGFL